jgi:hypothetical protein
VAEADLGAVAPASSTMESGGVARLFELPADVHVGAVLFAGAAPRSAAANAGATWLGARTLLPNPEAVGAALREVAEARGDSLVLGYERSPTGPMIYGTSDVRDDDRAKAGLAALVKALGAKDVKAALAGRGLDLTAASTVIERVGDVTRVRLTRGDEIVSVALVRQTRGKLAFAAGPDGTGALRKLIEDDVTRLGSVPAARAVADLAGPDAMLALVADVAALSPAPRGEEERRIWVAGALVRSGDKVLLRAAVEPSALSRLYP